jgi:DNA-binding MarR family transcriptional regulator
MRRLYTYVPLDFDQALKDGRLRVSDYALGCHLACESFRELNTNRGVVTAYVSALADVFECDPATIRRALRRLKSAGWIEFPEPDERQRTPWQISLTGLAREVQTKETATPTATPHLRHESQSSATGVEIREGAEPLPERDSAASRLRPSRGRENETKRNERLLSEEKLDHVLGKTTAAEPDDTTDRMLAVIAALDDDGPRVSVEQAADGSLEWHGEPREGEQGFLEDCQALVDAGLASWIERPA